MKKVTRLIVCVLVVASLAACGASPRDNRKTDTKQSKTNALGSTNFDEKNTDLYVFAWGDPAGTSFVSTAPGGPLATNGINFNILGLADKDTNQPITSLSYLEVGIAVDKTSKRCGMYVGTDQYQYGVEGTPAFITVNPATTIIDATSITCYVSDAFSQLTIQILPVGSSAKVTIMDMSVGAFMFNQNFAVNPL